MPQANRQRTTAEQKRNVLLVEDDMFVAFGMRSALAEARFVVVGIAATAANARVLYAREKPNVVVLDLELHGLEDGLDFARSLPAEDTNRLLFVTASPDGLRARAKGLAAACLPKPFLEQELVESVQYVLESADPAGQVPEVPERLIAIG